MTISQTHLHLEATLILVVSMLVASSSTLALLLLYLLVDATTLQDWAQHNQTIQQLSPTIRWSIAHLHLIAGGLWAWSLAGIATGLGLLKTKPLARYGVWLWMVGIWLWSIWNIVLMWGASDPIHQQTLAILVAYAVMGLLQGVALYVLWRSERYFLQPL